MSRLPTPGSDNGTWGIVLNDFLTQAHNADGTLQPIAQSAVVNLTSDLAARVPISRTVAGHVLSADVTLAASDVGAEPAGLSLSTRTEFNGTYARITKRGAVKTAGYSPSVGEFVPVDLTAGSVVFPLPSNPDDNSALAVKIIVSPNITNSVTLTTSGGDVFNKAGGNTSLLLVGQNRSLVLQYDKSTHIWTVVGEDLPKSYLDQIYAGVSRTGAQASGVGEIIINADDYGVARNGITDDTAALDAAFAAVVAAAKSASVFGATAVLVCRGGRYIDNGSRVFSTRVVVRGEGPYNTIFYRKSGATGDYLTFNASYSGLENITIDGNKSNCPSAGDNVVLNAYRCYVQNSTITNAFANGITVGKGSASLGHRLTGLGISGCTGYGVQVIAASGSTDGMWSDIDVGQCGLSGVRISNGAQNLSNIHSWGNGLESASDNHGFYIDSSSSSMLACQAETNLGSGIFVTGSASTANSIVGTKLWGNVGAGLRIFSAPLGAVVGGEIYRNGVTNTSGTTSPSYAGIQNDSGTEWSITGVNVWDDSASVTPGSYSASPTFPYPGRASGALTQPYAYAEVSTADFNTLAGCSMRKERTRSGIAILIVGNSDRLTFGNNFGASSTVPTRAVTAGAVRVPSDSDVIVVAATSGITSILGGWPGRRATLIFTSASPGQITNSTSLQLAGGVNWTPAQNATLTVVFDGTNWWEEARKA